MNNKHTYHTTFTTHVTIARDYNQSISSAIIPTTFLFNDDPAGYDSVKFSSFKAVKKRGNNRYKYLSSITQHFQQHVTACVTATMTIY